MAHQVFISYAAADKATADDVCATLEAAGIGCWIAPRDIAPGERYAQAIVDAVRSSRAFVLVFSAAASASTQVEREVDRAVACGLPLLPLRIEDVVPSESLEYYLAGQHWLDALTAPRDASLERLTETLGALLAAEARTEPRSAPAAVSPPAPAPLREERKVVTSLFCDLVDSRRSAKTRIPRMSTRLPAPLLRDGAAHRRELRRDGREVHRRRRGRASSASPPSHEDDAERAVRAGAQARGGRGRPAARRRPRRRRCASASTPAKPSFGSNVTPGSGEGFLTGDAVNVAARLEAAAPPMGVVVGKHHAPAHRERDRLRGARARPGEGQARAVGGVAREAAARAHRGDTSSSGRRRSSAARSNSST